mgnify:CR=1 FL=1
MEKTEAERRIELDAIAYAKANRTRIARELTDPKVFIPEQNPVSVFMAGSPGAGKTEASMVLIDSLAKARINVLRIDPDELRTKIEGYTGVNSWLFQSAVSLLVERVHDRALDQGQTFLLDGTLSSYDVAMKNIERSLKRERVVQILYVYQAPEQAWKFVKAREAKEGRRIQPEDFERQYFAARQVVNRLKTELGKSIQVDLLMKNNDGSQRFYRAGVDQIDNHIPENYSPADVRTMLGLE